MPTYEITAPDGRTLEITGAQPPSESELNDIFARASGGETAPTQPQQQPTSQADAGADAPRLSVPEGMTAAAYLAGQAPKAMPAISKAAGFVAESPVAQKVIAHGVGAAAGEVAGPIGSLTGMVLGGDLKEGVGKAAAYVAKKTAASQATVGRDPVTGQFTKLMPSAWKEVIGKLGRSMGMAQAEGAAIGNLNDPAKVKAFLSTLNPDDRARLLRKMPASFAKEYSD